MSAHNPVTFTCMFGEKIYKFTTYNYGRSGKDKEPECFDPSSESVRLKIDDCKRSDIVFCQEFNNGMMTSFNEHHRYFGHKVNNGYTALLIKKETFPEERKQFPESKVDFCLPADHLGRHCTVKLDNIIVISWHGKFGEEKSKNLTKFLEHAFSLVKQYSLPIIIGGDFNLKAEVVKTAVEKVKPPNCFHLINNPSSTDEHPCYDYFIVLVPLFKAYTAIAQPPSPVLPFQNNEAVAQQNTDEAAGVQ